MQIITTGFKNTDIDAFASVIAYSNLQNLLNVRSIPVIVGNLNQSVTQTVRDMGFEYMTEFSEDLREEGNTFVLMDFSEPEYIPDFVDIDKVSIVYDHHSGFEEFWNKRIGNNARIEEIGAAATFVFQDIVNVNKLNDIPSGILLLLYTAIISNTLNLNASITKDKDREAVKVLRDLGVIPDNWDEEFFNEVSSTIVSNPKKAIKEDTKILNINNNEVCISQLELWNSNSFIANNTKLLEESLNSFNSELKFLTCPSISENRTYFLIVDENIKNILEKLLEIKFENNIGVLEKLILRKEIVKILQKKL